MSGKFFGLAFCWKDEPVAVNQSQEARRLSQSFETICRRRKIPCLVDVLTLPPARGMKGFFKPVPRLQDAVTSVWPSADLLLDTLAAENPETEEFGEVHEGVLSALFDLEQVLFWVPRLSVPSLADIEHRVARLQALGPGPLLGDLASPPERPEEPVNDLAHPQIEEMQRHEERLERDARYGELQYDRRLFRALANTANGDVQPGLEFRYHEEGRMVWAFYEGQGVDLGTLVAAKDTHGRLRMAYHHLNAAGELRAGHCFSYPELLPDGRLRMHEFWRWSRGDGSAGASQIEEAEGVTVERKCS